MTDRPVVSFVGTLPPPVTGMTVATSIVVDRVAERCGVQRFDISHPRFHRGLAWKLAKAWKSGAALTRLAGWPVEPGAPLYMVANAGGGIWYNIAHAAVARRRGFHIFLHHQVYNYVHRHDRRMARLVRTLGDSGTHVVLCREMRDAFRRLYRPAGDFLVVPNTIVTLDHEPEAADHEPEGPNRPQRPFRIGHISNLTVAKGLDLVLDTLVALQERSLPVRLILAGPPADRAAAELVSEARARLPDRIEYRGGVYGEEKWAFYADIDALLFPTRYAREAYPLVIAEALFSGVPVISYGRACIPTLIGGTGGVVIDPDREFVPRAVPILERWIERPAEYATAAESARARGAALRAEARRHLEALVDRMCAS